MLTRVAIKPEDAPKMATDSKIADVGTWYMVYGMVIFQRGITRYMVHALWPVLTRGTR